MKQRVFKLLIILSAASLLFLAAAFVFFLISGSKLVIEKEGLSLLNPISEWKPTSTPPQYGLFSIICGTLAVSSLSVIISLFIGTSIAILLTSYISSTFANSVLKIIDLIAGIPSVIFGFIGVTIFIPMFESLFSMATGECVLAASLLLSIMLLPFVVSTISESITNFNKHYELTSLALGISGTYYIRQLVLKALKKSIVSAAIMSFGRALGETMAVMMVIGSSPIFPRLLGRSETIASLTALEVGNAPYKSEHLSAIYFANLLLLIIIVIVFFIGRLIKRRYLNQ